MTIWCLPLGTFVAFPPVRMGSQAEMPDLLGLIVQAMGLHSGAPEARGSPRHRATDTEGCPSA